MTAKKGKLIWIALRDGEPCNSFNTRPEAIKWLIKVLKQEISDYKGQDVPCNYDYEPEIGKIKIIKVEPREPFLGS